MFQLLIDKWIRGHCRSPCLLCKWRYECIEYYKQELKAQKKERGYKNGI